MPVTLATRPGLHVILRTVAQEGELLSTLAVCAYAAMVEPREYGSEMLMKWIVRQLVNVRGGSE